MTVVPVVALMSNIVMWVFGSGANWRVMPRPIPEAPPSQIRGMLVEGLSLWVTVLTGDDDASLGRHYD
jgi:hypothetical protein